MDKASVKVPGGKLVRVKAEFDDVLTDISITGDFFIEPPQAHEKIGQALEGIPVDFSEQEVVETLEDVDAELIGFSPEHIAKALKQVVQ